MPYQALWNSTNISNFIASGFIILLALHCTVRAIDHTSVILRLLICINVLKFQHFMLYFFALNMFLCIYSTKCMVLRQTMYTLTRLLLQEQSVLGLHCLHMPFYQASWWMKVKTFTILLKEIKKQTQIIIVKVTGNFDIRFSVIKELGNLYLDHIGIVFHHLTLTYISWFSDKWTFFQALFSLEKYSKALLMSSHSICFLEK